MYTNSKRIKLLKNAKLIFFPFFSLVPESIYVPVKFLNIKMYGRLAVR
jgi:hypothetical protein